jgi:hypothetical protein
MKTETAELHTRLPLVLVVVAVIMIIISVLLCFSSVSTISRSASLNY